MCLLAIYHFSECPSVGLTVLDAFMGSCKVSQSYSQLVSPAITPISFNSTTHPGKSN